MPDAGSRRRLDQPAITSRRLPELDTEAFGRVAERLARFLGTGTYLLWQSVAVVIWITLNVVMVARAWDPYPFILLNLAFSTQAAYAAPLILLAQNRQDDRDRVALEEDRARAARTSADTEYLARELASLRLAAGELVTRDFLRSELERGDRPERAERTLDRATRKAVEKSVEKAVHRSVERAVEAAAERAIARTQDHAARADGPTAVEPTGGPARGR